VHVDAVGAAIEERGSQADQFQQRGFESGFAGVLFDAQHGGIRGGMASQIDARL
jgi:hypothetical protein